MMNGKCPSQCLAVIQLCVANRIHWMRERMREIAAHTHQQRSVIYRAIFLWMCTNSCELTFWSSEKPTCKRTNITLCFLLLAKANSFILIFGHFIILFNRLRLSGSIRIVVVSCVVSSNDKKAASKSFLLLVWMEHWNSINMIN